MRLRSDFRAAVTIKNCLNRESAKERAELFFISIKDGILLQGVPGGIGTSRSCWSTRVQFFFGFVCSSLRLQLIAICCYRREVSTVHTHTSLLMHVNTHSLLHITLHGFRLCWCASCHLHCHPCHAPQCCLILDSLFFTLFLSGCFYLNL